MNKLIIYLLFLLIFCQCDVKTLVSQTCGSLLCEKHVKSSKSTYIDEYMGKIYKICQTSKNVSWVLHVIFSCVNFISFTLWVACMPLENPSAYNMYLLNLRITNHILIKKKEDNKDLSKYVRSTSFVTSKIDVL